jgi:hypothetical protein
MSRWSSRFTFVLTLALAASVMLGGRSPSRASSFPVIPARWVDVGAYQDSSNIGTQSNRCVGSFLGPRPDSLRRESRALSLRWLRDRAAEARIDFGGYRIYRMVGPLAANGLPDSSSALLIRRYSLNPGSEMTWNFSKIDTVAYDISRIDTTITISLPDTTFTFDTTWVPHPTYMQYICRGAVVHDSIITFVDPDSTGNYVKVCRRRDAIGACLSVGDSVFVLEPPPGPHDGFRTWYSITYERLNTSDTDYEDMNVPDTLNTLGAPSPCGPGPGRVACYNLNNKLINVVGPYEPTGGPTANLERVRVVPNPFRGSAVWDAKESNEIHFIALPQQAKISIYTVAGDLVRELRHDDKIRDFERWDLKSGSGRDVASGIYIYRVEAGSFSYQNRFVVIR